MSEIIIYHIYNRRKHGTVFISPNPNVPHVSRLSKFLLKSAGVTALVGILILAINYAPTVAAWAGNININLSHSEVQNITQTKTITRSLYQPPFDPRLPKTDRLIIPTIGVSTTIEEATYDNYESALKEGVWRVSDFGQPSDNSMPTILAAHRFGYLAWSNLFRRQNSFYNLPKLNVGDTVEIDWGQRKYVYEVYSGSTGAEITDYSADLILYTCVDLNGPDRIFRYARLLSI